MRALVMALCLVACSPEPQTSGLSPAHAPSSVESQAGEPRPASTDVRGEWRLATINGQTPPPRFGADATPPILMTVGDFTLRAHSQCVSFWRRYERDGDAVVVTDANPGAMCARGLSEWETAFDRALSATTAMSIVGERLRLAGLGVDMTFDRAAAQPVQNIKGRWRVRDWHGRPPPVEARDLTLEIDDREMRASACVFAGWRYRQDGPLLEITPLRGAVCERTVTPWEAEFAAFITQAHRATLLPDGDLILDSPSTQVAFTRAD